MKPAAFDYVLSESIQHAVTALAGACGDGKILAGGQSLMPMMNFRLVKPSVIVDINAIVGLDTVTLSGNKIVVGALVRHRMTASDPLIARRIPALHHAMKHVAHLTVRNRGTFCGSVCHADPAAEMPMMALLSNGLVHIASPRGERILPADQFLVGSLMTALEPDELVTRIELETMPTHAGWGFHEFARRHGDYALAAVVTTVRRSEGRARDARLAVMGVGEMARRLPEVEALLEGSQMDDRVIAEAIAAVRSAVTPNSDINASSDYRRHLVGVLAARALRDAWSRAREEARI